MVTSRLVRSQVLAIATTVAAAGPAFAQKLGGAADTDVPVWRVITAFLLCAGLAVVAALALRARLKGSAPLFSQGPRRLLLLESTRVSHQTDVCLMSCDGKEFIVAVSPQGVTFHPGFAAPASSRRAKAQGTEGGRP